MYLTLKSDDRLAILRKLDSQRKWTSLDDRRLCQHCHRVITGRQIEITRERQGQHVAHCPTSNCRSTVNDWIYATAQRKRAAANAPVISLAGMRPAGAMPS